MARLLNRDGTLILDDPWVDLPVVTPDAELPEQGYILSLENTVSIRELAHELLDRARGIALHFPAFTDGRAYSQARELRQRGYAGEIRALGDVLADQLLAMRRCGFSSFALVDAHTLHTAQAALRAFVHAAQPAVDNRGLQTRRLGEPTASDTALLL